MTMHESDLHYPAQSCPFCTIAAAYPAREPLLWSKEGEAGGEDLLAAVPEGEVRCGETSPASFVVLAARGVMAFLDILPMVGGHLLVATREHRVKVEDVGAEEGRDIGFWLPILARVVKRVTGVSDYNIVQNNGARAAQVVPHVHFHIIPRPESRPEIKSRSWTMFGRGQRDELDDDEGTRLAGEMRRVLRDELERVKGGVVKL